jgi:hypothetical protein
MKFAKNRWLTGPDGLQPHVAVAKEAGLEVGLLGISPGARRDQCRALVCADLAARFGDPVAASASSRGRLKTFETRQAADRDPYRTARDMWSRAVKLFNDASQKAHAPWRDLLLFAVLGSIAVGLFFDLDVRGGLELAAVASAGVIAATPVAAGLGFVGLAVMAAWLAVRAFLIRIARRGMRLVLAYRCRRLEAMVALITHSVDAVAAAFDAGAASGTEARQRAMKGGKDEAAA